MGIVQVLPPLKLPSLLPSGVAVLRHAVASQSSGQLGNRGWQAKALMKPPGVGVAQPQGVKLGLSTPWELRVAVGVIPLVVEQPLIALREAWTPEHELSLIGGTTALLMSVCPLPTASAVT